MRNLFIGVLMLVLFVLAVAPARAGIEPGTGWRATCDGEVGLLKSIYWGEVWVKCDMPERNIGKSQDWERGCYNLIHVWRVFPGYFVIECEEDGIP